MQNSVKTSVVLTTHNYGRFLGQCLESVLNQTNQEWEVIVVDDGSTDDTETVLAGYSGDPRLTVHRLSGVGLAAAANHGIRHGKGIYVMRLDADDFLDPHAIALLGSFLDRNPDIGLVYPDHFTVNQEGTFLGYTRTMHPDGEKPGTARPPLPGGSLCRRICYDTVGGYNESLRYQEDYDFWLRLTARYKVAALHLPLLYYRQHARSMSRNAVSRAEARRHVKRTHADRVTGDRPLRPLIVIPTDWPGKPARSQGLLRTSLGDCTLLDHALRFLPPPDWDGQVVMVGGDEGLKQACNARGLSRMAWPEAIQTMSGWPAPLEFLQSVTPALEASASLPWDIAILLSPYCPFRHPERLAEVVNTIAIHRCDLVLSIGAESAQVWREAADGLTLVEPHISGTGGARLVREAGELWGVRREVLENSCALDACRVGYIELLPIEEWTVMDEVSARVCDALSGAGLIGYPKPGELIRHHGNG